MWRYHCIIGGVLPILCKHLLRFSTQILETLRKHWTHFKVVHLLLWNCSGNFSPFFQTWELSPFPAKIWKTVLVLCNQLLPQFSTQIPETSHTDFKHIEVVQILIWNCLTNFFLFFQTWELSRFPAKIWRTVLVLCNHLLTKCSTHILETSHILQTHSTYTAQSPTDIL